MASAPARLRAADRREQILAVATALFARQGFNGTTTKEVAANAGVTEALIFRHFPSKEDLYWAVIDILERRAKDQTLSRLLLYSALENHRLSHRFFRAFVAGYYGVLAEYIARRTRDGIFRPVDPVVAARGFLGMVIYHSWVQELFGGKRYEKLSVQQVSRTLVDVWLQGMLQPVIKGRRGRDSANGDYDAVQEPNRAARS
jgi:AcrR family transcriptional regulator